MTAWRFDTLLVFDCNNGHNKVHVQARWNLVDRADAVQGTSLFEGSGHLLV
jgi:hypothetical protein